MAKVKKTSGGKAASTASSGKSSGGKKGSSTSATSSAAAKSVKKAETATSTAVGNTVSEASASSSSPKSKSTANAGKGVEKTEKKVVDIASAKKKSAGGSAAGAAKSSAASDAVSGKSSSSKAASGASGKSASSSGGAAAQKKTVATSSNNGDKKSAAGAGTAGAKAGAAVEDIFGLGALEKGVRELAQEAENIIQDTANAVQELVSFGGSEIYKLQERVMALGYEGSKYAENSNCKVSEVVEHVVEENQQNLSSCSECSQIINQASRTIFDEISDYTNRVIARNIELSKGVLACQTIHDALELNSQLLSTNIEESLNESVKLSEMWFDALTQASEPVSRRMVESLDKMANKVGEVAASAC